ncbi:hypothetical protein PCLA_03r0360 [Pseudomonas citronellolis]|nr:hypothetical protein PCLA_03r0360 [Pseudomonas citronellolis]
MTRWGLIGLSPAGLFHGAQETVRKNPPPGRVRWTSANPPIA